MSTATLAQVGVKKEASSYGNPATVDRFYEFQAENWQAQVGRIEGSGMRRGGHTQRADRWVPVDNGAAGDLTMEVLSKGFGFWLEHMLGSVATGSVSDSRYTHTGTVGSLLGKSFTAQSNRPLHPANTDQPFTYTGGKVTKWEIGNDVRGLLIAKLSCDFQTHTTATSLASASYPSAMELFSFVGGTITVDGTQFDVTTCRVSGDNGLKVDRQYVRGSALKKEPVELGWRQFGWALAGDFSNLDHYDRYRSATAAGAIDQIVLTWEAPTLIGVSAKPQFVVTVDEARFDECSVSVGNPDPLAQMISGRGLFDGSASPLTIEYKSADSTA